MSLIGDLTGGLIGESSAEKAAKAAKAASAEAKAEAQGYVDESWDYLTDTLQPYADYGTQGMEAVAGMQSPDAPTLQQFQFGKEEFEAGVDPGYQFRLAESLRAADRGFSKNRNLGAGNRAIGLADRAGEVASNEYQNAWQRALTANTANNQTLSGQYALNANKYGMDLSKNQYLADVGFGAAQRLGDYKYRAGVDKGNLAVGHAANTTAADMFQAQAKSQFVSDGMNLIGTLAGGA